MNAATVPVAFGVDVCEIPRMAALLERRGAAAVHRVCTAQEAAWVGPDAARFAAVFALKEASIKAMAGRPAGFRWQAVRTGPQVPVLPAAAQVVLDGFGADLGPLSGPPVTVGCSLAAGWSGASPDRGTDRSTGPSTGAGRYATDGDVVYAASCFWWQP